MSAYDKVLLARAKGRPTGLSYIEHIFQDFIELHGDRRYADDPAIVGGVASLEGKPVTVIAMEKGGDMKDKVRRNFGSPNPEGYRKALRLMKQAEKFHRPVICFVDTSGAFCGLGAEERGQGQAIAENLLELSGLKTPVISPEGCASILWKDAKKVKDAAECLHITAQDMEELGVVEKVIPEEKDPELIYSAVKDALLEALPQLEQLPLEELLQKRYERFRKF